MITAAQVKKFCPSAKAEIVNAVVNNWQVAIDAGITTDLRVQHFMTQFAVETGGLKAVSESLNYTPAGLISTFGPHRITKTQAAKYGRTKDHAADQEAIANIVYGGGWGKRNLGNTQDGDGWKYRGGGGFQTTGRDNYRDLGFEDNPEALRDPVTAFKTAVREWAKRGCNALADKDNLTAVRHAVNGGENGLEAAETYLSQAKRIFKSVAAPAPAPADVAVASVPAPAVTQAKAPTDDHLVSQVQGLLRDKGYPEVGEVDGKFGNRTRNAILAFQADNNMPLTGLATDDVLAALVKAPVRQQSETRATATAQDLKDKGVPTVQIADQAKKGGQAFLALMTTGAVTKGTVDFNQINDKLTSAKGLYDTVVSFSPWIIGAAVAGVVIYFGTKIIKAQVAAYRAGHTV